MPLYTFTNQRGEQRDLLAAPHVRLIRRGGQVWRRNGVQCFGVIRRLTPPGQREEVLAGYRKLEEKHGTRMRSKHSAAKIKRAWATP